MKWIRHHKLSWYRSQIYSKNMKFSHLLKLWKIRHRKIDTSKKTHRKIEEKNYLCNLLNYFLFYLHGTPYDVRFFFYCKQFFIYYGTFKAKRFEKNSRNSELHAQETDMLSLHFVEILHRKLLCINPNWVTYFQYWCNFWLI